MEHNYIQRIHYNMTTTALKILRSWVWWHMSVIPPLRRLGEEGCESGPSLVKAVRPSLKNCNNSNSDDRTQSCFNDGVKVIIEGKLNLNENLVLFLARK